MSERSGTDDLAPRTIEVRLRYFASIREALGQGESVRVAAGSTVGSLRDQLIGLDATHARALARARVLRAARNQTMCDESAQLEDGDEVAFFPPVTGG